LVKKVTGKGFPGCEERAFRSRRERPQAEEDGFFFILLRVGYGDELRGPGQKNKGKELRGPAARGEVMEDWAKKKELRGRRLV
jgi:hypothetical protein